MKTAIATLTSFILFSGAAFAQTGGNICEPGAVVPPFLDLGANEALTIKSETGMHEFSVMIADSREEQTRGLMHRSELAPTSGMLFEFAEPRQSSIWMRNTYIPLDLLFVREDGSILKIVHSAEPCSRRSHASEAIVGAVLELAGGRAQELGIIPGDVVQHAFFGNVENTSENDAE